MNSCICRVKDTILKAIHNNAIIITCEPVAVFAASKIQFWKQFTTKMTGIQASNMLYLPRQRYNFESNSQQHFQSLTTNSSCICRVKDTILKAIHNRRSIVLWGSYAVFAASKIQFWKQFTTINLEQKSTLKLYLPRQRYNFESNSQLLIKILVKRKAVFAASKIQFWKQFTTHVYGSLKNISLYLPRQRYNFESNSQQWRNRLILIWCCICRVKDTILKAIHNNPVLFDDKEHAVFAASKIQFWKQFTTVQLWGRPIWELYLPRQRYNFESNSQHFMSEDEACLCCICRVKDTILKAIHNGLAFWTYCGKLYLPRQRYNFESNSQHNRRLYMLRTCCICRVKDTILKAIHNRRICA